MKTLERTDQRADDLHLSTNRRIKYGTEASPSEITKTMVIPYGQFTPRFHNDDFGKTIYLYPGSTGTQFDFIAPIVLPLGVVIQELEVRLYRNDSGDSAEVELWQGSDTSGQFTKLAEIIHGGTGWATLNQGSIGHTVSSDIYNLFCYLEADGTPQNARLLWAKVSYDVENLSQSL